MFIPLRTSRDLRRRPRVTAGLVMANMIVYLLALAADRLGVLSMGTTLEYGALSRADFAPWQLITSQFLHDPGSVLHLAFNMLFLWVFGGPVEDRLGRGWFLAFYLGGGVAAGLGHMAASANPVIGASGAVAAVTGAFVVLAPRAKILVLFVFFLIGTYAIPAMWFVGIYFALDLVRSLGDAFGGGGSRVAYVAHLAGYAYGFSIAMVLLATQVLPRDDFDLWFLFRQARRRAEFRRAASGTPSAAWESASADTAARLDAARAEEVRQGSAPAFEPVVDDPESRALREAREGVVADLTAHRGDAAMDAYVALLERAPRAVLSQDRQLEIATRLHAAGRVEDAATAFELFVEHYPNHREVNDARLALSALLVRHLERPADALPHLDRAATFVSDPDRLALIATLRAEAGAAGAGIESP